MPNLYQQGLQAQNIAEHYLQQLGFVMLVRNFHGLRNEIDLIALEHNILCFIEVRSRKSTLFGGALASVGITKQRHIIIAAQYFLSIHPCFQKIACRFDVVAVQAGRPWLTRNAFCVEEF